MPTWSEILEILIASQGSGRPPDFDGVRKGFLNQLSEYTGRNCILYAAECTQGPRDPNAISINESDMQGFMEVVYGLEGESLDLILHSTGGSGEAAAAIVYYLRSKFSDIRVFVPHIAMSAATMIGCAANVIVMGRQSSIGPIDPQLIIPTQTGPRMVPAQALLDEFRLAQSESSDPRMIGAWIPILQAYGPGLLMQSQNALALSKKYAKDWLYKYMFSDISDDSERVERAQSVANRLADHVYFKSHGHHINREEAREIGLRVADLETDQQLQDLVLSVYHATTHTFGGTAAVKLIENNNGRLYSTLQQQIVMPTPVQSQAPPRQPPHP